MIEIQYYIEYRAENLIELVIFSYNAQYTQHRISFIFYVHLV